MPFELKRQIGQTRGIVCLECKLREQEYARSIFADVVKGTPDDRYHTNKKQKRGRIKRHAPKKKL